MMVTFDEMPQSHHNMMFTVGKDALVTSQYDNNIRRDASSHHSMMLTFDKDASVASQYDVNIRQGCLSYITV